MAYNKFVTIGLVIIFFFIVIRFFISKYFYRSKLLGDMLKEEGKDKIYRYSQGRVFLLLSILIYFVTIGLLTSKALKPNISIDLNAVSKVIEALQYTIALFSGYVFGGKSIEAVKSIMTKPPVIEQTIITQSTNEPKQENVEQVPGEEMSGNIPPTDNK